jgi:two-component system KDP operon response regulator KdpE
VVSGERKKILIIEDEPKIVRLLKINLESVGYEVAYALNASDGCKAVEKEMPDLIVLDVMLPDGDGYSLCRRIREFSDVPVIMLTARAREREKIEGFESGADDYVTKPFSTAELIARVRAILKRAGAQHPSGAPAELEVDDLRISFSKRKVYRGATEIRLTHTEYNLLYHLAVNAGKVMLHEELLSLVWGPEYRDEVEYLRAYIRHLRKKIEVDPSEPRIIVSSPGIGYCFALPTGHEPET